MSGTDDPIHSGSTRVVPPAGTGDGDGDAASSGAANLLSNGTRLGEFEITGLIGEGGFGIVYAAYDHLLEREVAIKEYMPSALAARMQGAQVAIKSARHEETFEAGRRSFINEAKLLAQFDHPALVKVYRFWEANGTAYMVMPYYRGATLRGALKDLGAAPSEQWIRDMLEPLFDALETMHEANCYHRDIAPDNILILANGRPLLLDFGAARRVIGDITQALTVILKPGFAPLEQYANGPEMRQGPWTDVYALAAVVYYCISGRAPVPSVSRMMKDTLTPATELGRGQYSERFLAAIDRALAIQIDDRTPSIAQMRAEIGDEALSPAAANRGSWQSTGFAGTAPGARSSPLPDSGNAPIGGASGAGEGSAAADRSSAARAQSGAGQASRSAAPAAGAGGGPDVDATRVLRPDEIDPRIAANTAAARRAREPAAAQPPRSGPGKGIMIGLGAVVAIALAAGLAWLLIDTPRVAPVDAQAGKGAVALAPGTSTTPPGGSSAAAPAAPAADPATAAATGTGAPGGSAPPAPGASPTLPAPTQPATPPASPPIASVAPAPAPPAPPAAAAIEPFSMDTILARIHAERDPDWQVQVSSDSQTVRIGQDRLRFRIRSERAGHVYLLMVGTDRSHFYLLFPNSLDQNNRIAAGRELQLPRPGWAMVAGGPPGTNQFLAIVTASARDFGPAGLKIGKPFSEFDLGATASAYAASGARVLAGRPTGCTAAPDVCERFGATMFEIREVR